jgi:hypothetical protein
VVSLENWELREQGKGNMEVRGDLDKSNALADKSAGVARLSIEVLSSWGATGNFNKTAFYPGGTYPSRDAKKYCTTT